jgi:hypothetical protein
MTMFKFLIRATSPALILAPALLLAGCAGVGSYMHDALSPYGNPNKPAASEAVNMQRAQGHDVAVAPITPMPGDVWPGPLQPVPSLGDIQKNMNVPLSQEYNQRYGNQSAAAFPPASDQSSLLLPPGVSSRIANPNFIPPPQIQPPSPSFQVGQTLIAPTGPVGIVTSGSNGRYQTVAPINGQGGGILTPNGNGTGTLVGPDGQITTVPEPGQ